MFVNLCQHRCREVFLGHISKGLGRFREVMLMGVLLLRPPYVKNVSTRFPDHFGHI